jgi:hypothetical protein
MSYIGRSAKLSLKAQEKISFLATSGQTSKTGLSYTVGFIEVYVNGVLLTDNSDYTATNGNSITFTVALLLNDEVTVISLKTFTVADHYTKSDADTLLAAKAPIASPSFTGSVGIGTASPSRALEVYSSQPAIKLNNGTNAFTIGTGAFIDGSNSLVFHDEGVGERMRIDSSGNVGVGVTPESAWHSSLTALQLGGNASISAQTTQGSSKQAYFSQNIYNDGDQKYISTDEASEYRQQNGTHTFRVAPSGSADAAISFTNAMTIDNAGIVTKPNQPAFRACKDTGDTSSTGYIVWNASKINVGGHYSTSTGKFTAPVAGNYYFAVRALTASATQNNIWIGIKHNGNDVLQTYHSHINHSNISGEAIITMAANDYVQTYWGGTGMIHTGGTNHHIYSFFQGHLIG